MSALKEKVRIQYEELPYPHREPREEIERMQVTFGDCLDYLNHTCFGGRRDFAKPFRVLIAGGGTGDSLVMWAENLRNNPEGKITYLDFSEASRKVAEERLKVRGLHDKVTFITDSILNIPQLNLGSFDFINCTGVLHHLADPQEGLRALESVLAQDGAMHIMLYGKYGRFGIYPIQELMRLINEEEEDTGTKIENTVDAIKTLPVNNYFLQNLKSMEINNKAEIYDLFLHSRDRAYSIPEVYDFAASAGMEVVEFFSGLNAGSRRDFLPEKYVSDPAFAAKLKSLPMPDQHAVAEMLNSRMGKHCFYLMKKQPCLAEYELDMVPSLSVMLPLNIYEDIRDIVAASPGKVELKLGGGISFAKTNYLGAIFNLLDGKTSFRDIFKKVMNASKGKANLQTLLEEFRPVYEILNDYYVMFLRAPEIPAYEMLLMAQRRLKK